MTLSEHLPVYKTSYDLLLETFKFVSEFTKEYKYTLGDKIKNEILDIIASIYRANGSFVNRLQNIRSAREKLESFRLYIRLSRDLKLLNLQKFIGINILIESVSKQLFFWEKSFDTKIAGQNSNSYGSSERAMRVG